MAHGESTLDIRTRDVVRFMPREQAVQIAVYDEMIDKSFTDLEYGTYVTHNTPSSYRHTPPKRYKEDHGKPIVAAMAWSDLEIAQNYDFQEPNPKTMMRVGATALVFAEWIAETTNAQLAAKGKLYKNTEATPSLFGNLTQGVTGLHYVLLGSPEAVDDEMAEDTIKTAIAALTHEVVVPLADRSAEKRQERVSRFGYSR